MRWRTELRRKKSLVPGRRLRRRYGDRNPESSSSIGDADSGRKLLIDGHVRSDHPSACESASKQRHHRHLDLLRSRRIDHFHHQAADVAVLGVDHETPSACRAPGRPTCARSTGQGAGCELRFGSRGDTVGRSWSAPALEASKSDTSSWPRITAGFLALATGQCLTVGFRFHIRLGLWESLLERPLFWSVLMKRALTIATLLLDHRRFRGSPDQGTRQRRRQCHFCQADRQ